ncbi:hypothetical protein ACFQE0_13740 [Methylobacterium komagatae]|uniref:Uncharacterized protein n=1 Tax=Methylobacterium komagatae TaxID=374425 RepID=A0ABW2BMD6_9HYPH
MAGAVGRAAPGSPERIGALIRASLIPGLSEQQQGVVKTLLANEMETGKLTSDQREYAMAQAQGFPGTFIQYKDAQRRPLTPTVLSPGQTVLPPGEYSTPSFVAAPKEEAYTLSPGQQRMQGDRVVASVPDRDKSTEAEAKLRGEFTKQLGTFNDVQDGYRRLIAATEQREANPNSISPASDIALVFGYMRMLDPGSVVREGEYATAQNAGGVDDKVRNLYNKAINGEFLSDGQRQDFIDTAGRLYGQARQGAESVASRYSDLAKGQGLDEGRVVKLPDALKGPKLAPSRADPAADSGKRALPEVVKGGRPPEGYTWDSYLAKSKGILKDRPDLRPQLEDMLAKAGIDPRKLGK